MDETDIKVNGASKYLYRAVDKAGDTVVFLLRAHRDKAAARRFFEQAIERSGAPENVTIDKSGSNVAALDAINAGRRKQIVVRQIKYLNNIVEQDHRAIKRRTRPTLGFKDFRCARILLSGIEFMHMISQVEIWFGLLTRKTLRGGSFASKDHLRCVCPGTVKRPCLVRL